MTYFTADWHIGHENIIYHCDRPFDSAEEMKETIIENLQHLDTTDNLYVVGDLTGPGHDVEGVHEVLSRIPPNVLWLRGNHDPANTEAFLPHAGYESQRIQIGGGRTFPNSKYKISIVLDHYPLCSWNGSHHGHLHVHGHSHGNMDNEGVRRMDVGVDVNGFAPVSKEEVIDELLKVPAPRDKE